MRPAKSTAQPGNLNMIVLLIGFVGGVAGAFLLDGPGGFWTGAAVGALAGWVTTLSGRLRRLEQHAAALTEAARRAGQAASAQPPHSAPEAAATEPPANAGTAEPPATMPAATPRASERAASAGPRTAAETEGAARAVRADASAQSPRDRQPTAGAQPRPAATGGSRGTLEPTPLERVFDRFRRWLTTGNVPVKVGVVLSVFGVGFLVKEAIDRNWMVLPIELRLVLVAAFGLALLTIGWRLRRSRPVYAISMQGGGVAVLYLTIYASYAIYALLPALAAFAMLLVVTAAVGVLAVLQDARALAVLGVVGGFMAPVLTSSGAGNHVALLGYYAVLNGAIIGIAWFRSWRELNVLGFFFTFVIASLWGYTGYRPEHFGSTEPFLALFVLMYTAIPVLFANRQQPQLKGFVDGTLLFGTPIVGFALQTQLVGHTEYGLALSAVALAAMYVALASWLFRRGRAHMRVLIEALLSLGTAFLTIAVPLALDAQWTSAAWALEGAAMIWLGVRQRRRLALASGVALQVAAGAVHFVEHYAFGSPVGTPILNGALLGALLIAAAGALSSHIADRADSLRESLRDTMAAGLLSWATGWWLLGGLAEIDGQVPFALRLAAALAFLAATVAASTFAAPRVAWPRLAAVGLLGLPAIGLGAAVSYGTTQHPLADYGWAAWPAIFAAHAAFLRMHDGRYPRLRPVLHAGAHFLFAALVAAEIHWQTARVTDGVWPAAAAVAFTALLVAATLRATAGDVWPFGLHRRIYAIGACGATLAALVPATLALNASSPGSAPPLPFVPLLNPLELASALVAIVLVRAWRTWRAAGALSASEPETDKLGAAALAVLALFLLTMSVARTVHHWTGVPFEAELLARSTVLQAALSIVWGTAALGAMLLGARARRRTLWLAGATLMAAVVVKLFLVELGNAGTVGRVVSFLGVGLLLLVVGYFAPVPPRDRVSEAQA